MKLSTSRSCIFYDATPGKAFLARCSVECVSRRHFRQHALLWCAVNFVTEFENTYSARATNSLIRLQYLWFFCGIRRCEQQHSTPCYFPDFLLLTFDATNAPADEFICNIYCDACRMMICGWLYGWCVCVCLSSIHTKGIYLLLFILFHSVRAHRMFPDEIAIFCFVVYPQLARVALIKI